MMSPTRVLLKPTASCRHETIEQCRAEAMLLDMWYDSTDHTYNNEGTSVSICADTLKPITTTFYERRSLVLAGSIGFTRHEVAGGTIGDENV